MTVLLRPRASVPAPRRTLARWPLLVAACAVPATLEAVLTRPLGVAAQTLALQAAAPAPFGVFHDLRWLLVYPSSWWQAGLWLVGVFVARTTLTAAQVQLAWPAAAPRMPWHRVLSRAGAATLLAIVLLTPAAAIQYGMGIASVSYFFLGAVPVTLVLALLLHPALLRPWWRSRPTWRSSAWIVLTFLFLSAGGASLLWLSPWQRIGAVLVLSSLEAVAWRGIVGALVTARQPRALPVAPVALVALVGVVVGVVTFAVGNNNANAGPSGRGPVPVRGANPVLEISGFGDGWHGTQTLRLPSPYQVVRFSYLGSEPDGAPRYYDSLETYQPLPHLVHLVAAQVDALHRRTGQPVTLVAESEGALLAETYLLADPRAPVTTLVVASPLVEPVRVYYPTHGSPGAGLVGSVLVDDVSHALAHVTPLALPPDPPLFAAAQTHGPAVREEQFCLDPGVRQLDIFPLADALSTPYHGLAGQRVDVIAAFHGGDLAGSRAAGIVAGFVEGHQAASDPTLGQVASAAQALAMAWDVPPTAASDVPAWRALAPVTSCAQDRAELASWLGAAIR